MHFLENIYLYFDLNYIEVCSRGSNWQQVNIGLGYGLVPIRYQAITWTNVGKDLRCTKPQWVNMKYHK